MLTCYKSNADLAIQKIDRLARQILKNNSDILKLEADMCSESANLLRRGLNSAQIKSESASFSREREPIPYSIN